MLLLRRVCLFSVLLGCGDDVTIIVQPSTNQSDAAAAVGSADDAAVEPEEVAEVDAAADLQPDPETRSDDSEDAGSGMLGDASTQSGPRDASAGGPRDAGPRVVSPMDAFRLVFTPLGCARNSAGCHSTVAADGGSYYSPVFVNPLGLVPWFGGSTKVIGLRVVAPNQPEQSTMFLAFAPIDQWRVRDQANYWQHPALDKWPTDEQLQVLWDWILQGGEQ